jgi:acyl dehydratase
MVLYFDDIEVGEVRALGQHAVSRDEIVRFAGEWDPQPFHTDDDAAADSIFGGLTASSCHTYSISSLVFHKSGQPMAVAAMLGLELRFPTPVRPGDVLSLRDECLEKRLSKSRPGFGVVKSRSTLANQKGEEVFVMDANYLVQCR